MKRFFPLLTFIVFLWPSTASAIPFCPDGALVLGQGCDGIPLEGCCAADMVIWCETSTDTLCAQTCSLNTDVNTTCGWKAFSYECVPVQVADPTGTFPLVCGTTPSNECVDIGPKGCCMQNDTLKFCDEGVVKTAACGANTNPSVSKCGWKGDQGFYDCVGGNIADPTGTYPLYCPGEDPNEGCEPACGNLQCGDDGCGGSCGTCTGQYVCNNGYCAPPTCTPLCDGKNCGPDGCGGSCGTCAAGINCSTAGVCMDGCVPTCTGKQCGDDGCGGSCGDCPWGMSCTEQQQCSGACTPDCVQLNKQCGDDGCGGSCGTCGVGLECNAQFQCNACTNTCNGKQCGEDGCGGVCGYCGTGQTCSAFGFCILNGCTPYCAGKQCGEDGCGGQCGVCALGSVCSQGLCVGGSTAPTDTTDGAIQCAPGQVLQYGECVYPSPGPVPAAQNSGCAHSSQTQSSGWSLAMLSLLFFMVRRRRALT